MTVPISLLGGAITGLANEAIPRAGAPLIVLLPGGGSWAGAFNTPGRSFLSTLADLDLPAIALNRPGQGDSARLPLGASADTGAFAANADVLLRAIDEIWRASSNVHRGVLIHGVSIGGAIALHMAARWSDDRRAWPLLGVAVSDIGQEAPNSVVQLWRSLPLEETIYVRDHGNAFAAGVPEWSLPIRPPPSPDAPVPNLSIPRAELQEVVGGWPREWRGIASRIAVPAQYVLAQYDVAWVVSKERMTEFSMTLCERSPYVESRIFHGASHAIAAGPLGVTQMLDVASFALRCAVYDQVPEMVGRPAQ